MKARPWFDIFTQVEAVAQVVPADYKFDFDFNGFLLDAARAEVTLSALDEYPHIDMYESPFYRYKDLDGARLLRQQTRNSLIEHFDQDCLRADCCDGFVLGGHPLEIMRQGTLAAASNKPFWIQHVGTGITAHELWEHDLLMARLYLQNGYLAIPDAPGLGVEIDEKSLATYQVDEDQPHPKRAIAAKSASSKSAGRAPDANAAAGPSPTKLVARRSSMRAIFRASSAG